MSTFEHRTNFADKRNMPQNRVKDTFFDYLLLRLREISSRVWAGKRGIFGTTSLVSGGTDRFSVSGPFVVHAIDGDGNVLDLDVVDGQGVYFENEVAIDYYVGMRHCLIPSGVVQNPRIAGVIFYDTDEDRIGEVAEPDSVTEVAGTLEIEVDSVCEAGVSNAGRSVTVWLKRPRTTEEAVAIERNLTVAFSGGKNVVTTSGLLGQGSPASTNPADYQVALQGLTVKRNTDLSVTDPYAFLGTVTGGGAGNPPSAFSVLGQIDVSDGLFQSLQDAYLLGRTITPGVAGGGAVRIESLDSGDDFNSLLVLDRKGATEATPFGLTAINERGDGVAFAQLTALVHADPATELNEDEPGTSQAAVGSVNLTRVGVDLVAANVDKRADLVYLWDFTPDTSLNGLYKIFSWVSNFIVVLNLDGSAPTWSAGSSGNVSILRPRVAMAEPSAVGSHEGMAAALAVQGSNEENSPAPVKWHPWKSEAMADFYDDSPAPRVQGRITRAGTFLGKTTGTPGTRSNELFRSERLGNSDYFQAGFLAEMGDLSAVPFVAHQPIEYPTDILAIEDVTLAGNTVTFTRGAVDLVTSGLVHVKMSLLLVEQSDDPADDGLYSLVSFTANTADVADPHGGIPAFVGPNAKARILMTRFQVGNVAPFAVNGEFLAGNVLALYDGENLNTPFSIFPIKADDSVPLIRIFNRGDGVPDPELCAYWGMVSAGGQFHPRWVFGEENASFDPVHCGVNFKVNPGPDADELAVNVKALPPRQLSGESLYNRAFALINERGAEMMRFEQGGRISRVSEFFDDFQYQSQPHGSIWSESVSGGTVFWDAGEDGVGVVRATAAGAGNYGGILRFGQFYMKHQTAAPAIHRILNFAGRFRPVLAAPEDPDYLQMRVECYLQFAGSYKVGCVYEAIAANDQFRFFAYDGVTENLTAGHGAAGPDLPERGWFKFWMQLDLQSGIIVVSHDHEETANSNGIDALAFPTPGGANWAGKASLGARVTSKNANTHGIEVDYLHVWDEVIKTGGKDRLS